MFWLHHQKEYQTFIEEIEYRLALLSKRRRESVRYAYFKGCESSSRMQCDSSGYSLLQRDAKSKEPLLFAFGKSGKASLALFHGANSFLSLLCLSLEARDGLRLSMRHIRMQHDVDRALNQICVDSKKLFSIFYSQADLTITVPLIHG
jgi:hypothetical protein